MRTSFLTLAICACLAAADVSHLSSSYLPPAKPEQAISMSIEQQELRELPEQVEYMRENEQGAMEHMPSSLLTPPAAAMEAEQMEAMLATRYLPPAQQPQAEEPAQPAEVESKMQPADMAPEPEQPAAMDYMSNVMPAMQYQAPAPQAEQPQQLTYQQYQEQLQQQQQPQQEEQMPYILDVQQPMAPSDVEMQAYEPEAQPAHELRSDGYHYKQAEEEQRLRH